MMKRERFYGQKLPVMATFEQADAWCNRRRNYWQFARWVAVIVLVYFLEALYIAAGIKLSSLNIFTITGFCYFVVWAMFKKYCPSSDEATYEVISVDEKTKMAKILYSTASGVALAIIDNFPVVEIVEKNGTIYEVKFEAYDEIEEVEVLRMDSTLSGQMNIANFNDDVALLEFTEFFDLLAKVFFPIITLNQIIIFGNSVILWILVILWAVCAYFDHQETIMEEFSSDGWDLGVNFADCEIDFSKKQIFGKAKLSRNTIFTQRVISKTVHFTNAFEILPDDKIKIYLLNEPIEVSLSYFQQDFNKE